MSVCNAVVTRIKKLLEEKKITQYRLEQKSGVLHGTMMGVMAQKNKNVTLRTIMQIANGFNMTLLEFLNDPIFDSENFDFRH